MFTPIGPMKPTSIALFMLVNISTMFGTTFAPFTLADSSGTQNPGQLLRNSNFVLKIHHSQCAECGFFEATIAADGHYNAVANPGKAGNVPIRTVQGKVSPQDVRLIQQQIAKTNFGQVKSKPAKFCATAFDGSEATYTFVTRNGLEVIPECTYDLEPKLALFKQADRLYNQIGAAYLKPYQPKH
jgi:hypothetical protein